MAEGKVAYPRSGSLLVGDLFKAAFQVDGLSIYLYDLTSFSGMDSHKMAPLRFEAEILVENGSGKSRHPVTYFNEVYKVNMFKTDPEFALQPGPNRVTLVARSRGAEIARKSLVVFGNGQRFTYGRLEMVADYGPGDGAKFYSGQVLKSVASAMAAVSEMNRFLGGGAIERVNISWSPGRSGVDIGSMTADSGIFSFPPGVAAAAFTRAAAMELAKQVSLIDKAEWQKLSGGLAKAGKSPRALAIFSLAGYLGKAPSAAGSTPTTPQELFASATAVLIHHPKEFMAKARALAPADRAVAQAVARAVAGHYLKNPNCPKDFLDPALARQLNAGERQRLALRR